MMTIMKLGCNQMIIIVQLIMKKWIKNMMIFNAEQLVCFITKNCVTIIEVF